MADDSIEAMAPLSMAEQERRRIYAEAGVAAERYKLPRVPGKDRFTAPNVLVDDTTPGLNDEIAREGADIRELSRAELEKRRAAREQATREAHDAATAERMAAAKTIALKGRPLDGPMAQFLAEHTEMSSGGRVLTNFEVRRAMQNAQSHAMARRNLLDHDKKPVVRSQHYPAAKSQRKDATEDKTSLDVWLRKVGLPSADAQPAE